jgi:type II secretory pathway pseudopilin PulG
MKPQDSKRRNQAMTLLEAVVVIFVIAFLVAMLLPALVSHHSGRQRINCTNNLKQLGLAYRIWAGDNNDKYPMQVSAINGGAMELVGGSDAWKTFQVMSNELSTPKILRCPEDAAHGAAATNFGADLKNKISYFISAEATVANTNVLLSGDAHFLINGSPVKPGLIEVTSNTPIAWDSSRHVFVETHAWFFKKKTGWGNIGLGDGSVQSLSSSQLLDQIKLTGFSTNRLAIP